MSKHQLLESNFFFTELGIVHRYNESSIHLTDWCWKTEIDVNYGWSNFSLLRRTSNTMLHFNLSVLNVNLFLLKQAFYKIHLRNRGILLIFTINFFPVLLSLWCLQKTSISAQPFPINYAIVFEFRWPPGLFLLNSDCMSQEAEKLKIPLTNRWKNVKYTKIHSESYYVKKIHIRYAIFPLREYFLKYFPLC